MIAVLERELRAGLPGLRGSRLRGSLPLRQPVLAAFLRQAPAPLRDVQLEVHEDNELVVRYGMVHASARLDEMVAVGDGAPRVGVVLASTLVAWPLRAVLSGPHIRVDGRRVTVDLGAVAALQPYAALWPHLRQLRLVSGPGVLVVHAEIVVA